MPPGNDKYDQFLYMTVTMSGANSITFSQLSMGISIFDYAALIVSRVEYYLSAATLAQIIASSDECDVAVSGSKSLTALTADQPEIYDLQALKGYANGTPASGEFVVQPYVHDFSNMAGGGLLIPAQDMYLAMQTAGFSTAGVAAARVYFRIIKLNAADYLEIAQRLRVLST